MPTGGEERLQARLFELFVEELDDQLDRLDAGLEVVADALPDVPADTVAELFRAAHSLKGAAQAVHAVPIASACHELEDLLAKVRDQQVELDAATADRLRVLVDGVGQRRVELLARHADAGSRPGTPTPASAPRSAESPESPASSSTADSPSAEAPSGDGSAAAPAPSTRSPAPASTAGATLVEGPAPAASRTPSDAAPAAPRLAGHKIDALVAHAGDLITAGYTSEALVARLATVGERLVHDARQRQHERSRVLSLLSDVEERRRVAKVLDEADERLRSTTYDLDQVVKQVQAHQKSLRGGAASFAEAARRARTVPFEQVTSGLARQVRELAAALHKEVELDLTATDAEVDRELVLTLREVLGHLVRNALDHGIESPDDRVAVGKPPAGTIRVAASLRSDGLHVLVSDDGQGVDEQRVREAAEQRDLTRRGGGELTIAEAMFAAGVSTAAQVTAVSGRGVGLDAVRSTVEATGGTITVATEAGCGTTMRLVLPLNLSTIRALLVTSGDDVIAFPSATVRQLMRVPAAPPRLDGGSVTALDDEVVPLVRLDALLGWDFADSQNRSAPPTGLVVSSPVGAAVFVVDSVSAEREIVLRSSPQRLAGIRTVLGTAQLEDGRTILVLNPPACVRAALFERTDSTPVPDSKVFESRSVLLAEDSLTTREIERSLLESAGFSVVVASDGQQAWELLQANEVDAVVSDVNMPRMDGIALCRAIRESTRLEGLPVVLVTSLHSPADRQAGLDAGADAYLTKAGFNRDELVSTLERLL